MSQVKVLLSLLVIVLSLVFLGSAQTSPEPYLSGVDAFSRLNLESFESGPDQSPFVDEIAEEFWVSETGPKRSVLVQRWVLREPSDIEWFVTNPRVVGTTPFPGWQQTRDGGMFSKRSLGLMFFAKGKTLVRIRVNAYVGDVGEDYYQSFIPEIASQIEGTTTPTELILTSSKDSTLRAKTPNVNEGANPLLFVSHRPEVKERSNNPIIGFDLSTLDRNSVVSAKLILTIEECKLPKRFGKDGRNIEAWPVLRDWKEGNGVKLKAKKNGVDRDRGNGPGVTWNSPEDLDIRNKRPDGPDSWNGARDFLGQLTAPLILISNGQTGTVEFDVTSDVTGSQASSWLVRKEDEGNFGNIRFHSKESLSGTPPQLKLELNQ